MKNLQFTVLLTVMLNGMTVFSSKSQTIRGNIEVTVTNDADKALEGVTVSLLNTKDSTLAKAAISDEKGVALLENIKFGNYFLAATSIGFKKYMSASFAVNTNNNSLQLPTIKLIKADNTLAEVTVVSRKPFIEKKIDRIVVNVENSIMNAGSSALEVLERSPSVNVNQNDVISLRGKTGVIIMIDGKPTPIAGADLANYLRTLPSSAIERIDIITNPSAKYDAAGNSGIIDIRMKKDTRSGTNGTVTAGYGQGIYPKANAGLTLNYRNNKINAFGNYNYAYRMGLNHLLLDRNFYTKDVYNGGDLKDNYSKSPFEGHTTRIGMDYFPNKKTIIGFVVNSNFNHYRRNNNNNSIVLNSARQAINTFTSLATNNDHANNTVANINFKHTLDSTGKELTADLDYGVYNSNSLTVNATNYKKLDGTVLQPDYVLNGDQEGLLSFKTAKIDYVNPLKNGAKWEAGFKTSFVSADNDAKFTDVSTGTPQNDANKTNHFIYHENINAGYINFNKEFKHFALQLGLRGEQTNLKTEQLIGNTHFDSSYFQLYPTAFLNYKLTKDQTMGFSVSRRIDRPGYSQLNPFLFLIDVTTYATGRPNLLPQITWSYEWSYTLKNLNFALSYSQTKQNQDIAIAKFRDVFPNIPSEDNVTVQIPINLSSSDYFGLSVSAPIDITKWWSIVNNLDVYYQHFNGTLGNTTLNNGSPAADIRTNNSFSLKRGWKAELNANYSSSQRAGFMVLDPRWGVGVGVQKNILDNKGTFRFNITDIFWTNLPKAVITYNNYIEKWHAFRETRVATVTLTYRFGNSKVAQSRKRTTGSEEEKRRAG